MKAIDYNYLIGTRLDKLVAIEIIKKQESKKPRLRSFFKCKCDCGNDTYLECSKFANPVNKVTSCGCERLKRTALQNFKDGRRKEPEYLIWASIVQRCYNPNNKHYKDYGNRGITMCERWRTDYGNFIKDMGKRPEGLTIERTNNEGIYEPSNCKWATMKEQNSTRRNNKGYKEKYNL